MITYKLWEGKVGDGISGVFTLQAQLHTCWGKAKVVTASVRGSALCKHNHVHAKGRQRQWWHQQGGLHFARMITYTLWEGKGSDSISKGVCTLQEHNHIHPVGRQKQWQHQQGGLHFSSTITYILWEGKGSDSISEGVFTFPAWSHTFCGKAEAVIALGRGLHFASAITYKLWEGKGSDSIREGSALCKHDHIHSVGRQRQWRHQ